MQFLKDLGINLLILAGIGLVLFIISPEIMSQVFQVYGSLFGPVLIVLMVIVAALPNKRRRRR